MLCKRDSLLFLDCKDDSYELIPKPENMKPFKFIVFFSGLERSLANSAYNLRQDECKAAAFNLLAYAGLEYGKFKDTVLRFVPCDVFESYKDRLPVSFRRRALHFFNEYEREQKGTEAWKTGDIEAYGKLVFESGRSSIDNYECGCPELITLYNIMAETDGIYGGRFSGAGFKGCFMAIADPEKTENVIWTVSETLPQMRL